MSAIVKINNLTKSYGSRKVLENVSYELEEGQIIGLLGPNGSGKTSMIKILVGLINDYSGDVTIDGLKPGAKTKSMVAYLPEKTYLASWMTADDAVNYIADFYDDFDKKKAMEMLDLFQLPHKQKARTMSKGQQEKLQLILVMCRNARLYILDEPMGGVDPAARDYILNVIIENYDPSATILISTHLIADIESVLDQVIFLKNGQIERFTSVDDIREKEGKSVDALFREVFKC